MSVQMKTRAHSQDEAARTQLEKDPLSMVHGFGPSLQEMHTPVTCCVHAWKRTPVSMKHNEVRQPVSSHKASRIGAHLRFQFVSVMAT